MRKTIAKAVTWRVIGTAEIFAISFWTTGHIATAGHMAGIAAISSMLMYVAHELAWSRHKAVTVAASPAISNFSERALLENFAIVGQREDVATSHFDVPAPGREEPQQTLTRMVSG